MVFSGAIQASATPGLLILLVRKSAELAVKFVKGRDEGARAPVKDEKVYCAL